MTTPGPTTQDILDERYGRGRSASRRWAIVVGVTVARHRRRACSAWMTVANSLDAVDAETTGFEVVDEHSVTLRFQVSAPVGRSIACAIEAQDEEHGVVGWRIVEYPGSDLHARAFHEVDPDHRGGDDGFGQLLLGDVVCRHCSRYTPWREPGRLTYRPPPADRRSQTCPAMPR